MSAGDGARLARVVTQRVVFGAGALWGVLPLISVGFLALGGETGSVLGDASFVLTGITVLPANVLAFWFRSAAAVWLGVNAVVAIAAVSFGHLVDLSRGSTTLEFAIGSVVLATFAIVVDLRRWPAVLGRS